MNLTTTYLNMTLNSPLVASASPLSQSIDNIKRLEDAGASAVVLFSLFEEQMRVEQQKTAYYKEHPNASPQDFPLLNPSALQFRIDLDGYLEHVRKAKEAVKIPIIASINCSTLGSWTDFAQKVQQSGADALELNIYFIPADRDLSAEHVENMYLRILKNIKAEVSIPVAIKLAPFFTNIFNLAARLDRTGADGLVLFNRFYEPDLDPKTLKVQPSIQLSTPQDSRLPLHWIAILHGHLRADLAASGGISSAEDVVKMLMVGAKITMIASALLREGIGYLRTLDQDLRVWMEENEFASVAGMQGIINQFHSSDASTFERTEYIRAITTFKPIV